MNKSSFFIVGKHAVIEALKNPNRKIATMTINKPVYIPPGRLPKKCSIISSPPKPLKTKENIDAPMRIMKTNELNFTVPNAVSLMFWKVSSPFVRAIIAAPTAPTDADSVGVATPNKIEPNTSTINKMGGRIDFKASI